MPFLDQKSQLMPELDRERERDRPGIDPPPSGFSAGPLHRGGGQTADAASGRTWDEQGFQVEGKTKQHGPNGMPLAVWVGLERSTW